VIAPLRSLPGSPAVRLCPSSKNHSYSILILQQIPRRQARNASLCSHGSLYGETPTTIPLRTRARPCNRLVSPIEQLRNAQTRNRTKTRMGAGRKLVSCISPGSPFFRPSFRCAGILVLPLTALSFSIHGPTEYFFATSFRICSSGWLSILSPAFHVWRRAAFSASAAMFKFIRNSPWLRL